MSWSVDLGICIGWLTLGQLITNILLPVGHPSDVQQVVPGHDQLLRRVGGRSDGCLGLGQRWGR